MSVTADQLVEAGIRPEVAKIEIAPTTTTEEDRRAIGSLAVLKATILDYVRSPIFLNRLAHQGDTPDFHAVSTSVDRKGHINRIARIITLKALSGVVVEVVTHHDADEELTRNPLQTNREDPQMFAKARGPLVRAGLQGQAAEQATVYVRGEGRAYSLNGDFKSGPNRDELTDLTEQEAREARKDPLLVLVQDHLSRPASSAS